jgi:hypothetical protein
MNLAFAASLLLLTPQRVKPEVVDASSAGFMVKLAVNINATPDAVYRKFVHIGEWWSSEHTFSGDAHNLYLEEKAMGCFCEKLINQGAVKHMEVVYLAPGKSVVLAGALGPLQALAATGSMTISFDAAEGGTKAGVRYAVTGYLPAGMNTWAAPVDQVLREQFARLKNLVERGDAMAAEPKK